MNALFFVDSHGSSQKLEEIKSKAKDNNVDVIICAGDMTIFEDKLDAVLYDMDQIGVPILIIHGNHENEDKVRMYCDMYDNLTFIHRSSVTLDGVVFMGYGGGGFSETDPVFRRMGKKFKRMMRGARTSVLVLHGPPYGTMLDELSGSHHGSKDFTSFIREHQPDVVICGHLHENAGKEDFIGTSRIINPGPRGRILRF